MLRHTHKLTPKQVREATFGKASQRWLHDGGGLYLSTQHGACWVFRYKINGRARMMGLGPAHTVTVDEAREAAFDARRQLRAGLDPLNTRRLQPLSAAPAPTLAVVSTEGGITFADAVTAFITDRGQAWSNPRHVEQWRTTLADHATALSLLPVAAISTDQVLGVLRPLWSKRQTTASRLRGRIESVLDWAMAKGHRPKSDNPARWKGHLEHLLAAKTHKVTHLAALDYKEVPTFLRELAKQDTITARAIELLILTATRTGSIIDATWEQVDTTAATWSIPKTKNGNALTVPLTDAALAVLTRVPAGAPADKIFRARNGQLSPNAMLAALKRINPDVTVHGFRAAFKTWADEETDFPRDLVEVAMAHKVGNDVERSYQRGEKLEKRRKLMADWSAYCSTSA